MRKSCSFVVLLLASFVLLFDQSGVNAVNVCSSSKVVEQGQTNVRTIYSFTCTSVDTPNPSMPVIASSAYTDYNEMKLSPNFYTLLPLNQICQYANVYMLDLSSNSFASLTNAFKLLSCLSQLRRLDFSYNSVTTPIVSSDFADSLATNMVFLNLNNNQIPYIQSQTFTYANGTPRFPNLMYLGLANNQLKKLDLLWPLTLPSILLEVDMRNNPIDSLVNELGKSYSDRMYAYPVAGYRHVDVINNNIQSISDWNLRQYGITSATTFEAFLNMVLNYELRPANQTAALNCICPASGLYTNTWYQTFYLNASRTAPIYQLYCQNIPNHNIFSFPCSVAESSVSTTAGSLLVASGAQTDSNLMYLYLLLLLVPIAFVVFMVLCCCCFGRACQSCTYNCCSCVSFPCLRPDHHTTVETARQKTLDASVCYNEGDEAWVDKAFMSRISEFGRGFKLNKVTINQQKPSGLAREFEQSKRIVLIFSNRFLDREWKNKRFQDLLVSACINDPHSVLIAVNNSNLPDKTLKSMLFNLRFESNQDLTHAAAKKSSKQISSEHSNRGPSCCTSCWQRLRGRTRYNLALDDVEVLNFNDAKFWNKLLYAMPHSKEDKQSALETGRYKSRRDDSDTVPIRNEGESSSVSSTYNVNETVAAPMPRVRSRSRRRSSVVSPEAQVTVLTEQKSPPQPQPQKSKRQKKKKSRTVSSVHDISPSSSLSDQISMSPSARHSTLFSSSSSKDLRRKSSLDYLGTGFGTLPNLGPLNQI